MYLDFVAIVVLGFAIWWAMRLVLASTHPPRNSFIVIGITILSWILISIGLVAISGPFFLICIAILILVWCKYRESERRALLWTLAAAAEKEIPLERAAASFSANRIDEIGRRAEKLSEFINAGIPLPMALKKSRTPLPLDADLAVRIGYPTQTLHATLVDAAKHGDQNSNAEQSMLEGVLYVLMTLGALMVSVSFVLIYCVPTFAEIFDDFDLPLPPSTQLLILLSNSVANYLWVIVLFGFGVVIVGTYLLLQWLRVPLPELPLQNRLFGNRHVPVIFRSIRLSILQDRSMGDAIELLGKHYPVYRYRVRLQWCRSLIDKGVHWCDAFRECNLVSKTEASVLRSAERTGNLPWAFAEMAERRTNQILQKASFMTRVVSPLLLILVAIPVGFFAIAIIMPLCTLITDLANL